MSKIKNNLKNNETTENVVSLLNCIYCIQYVNCPGYKSQKEFIRFATLSFEIFNKTRISLEEVKKNNGGNISWSIINYKPNDVLKEIIKNNKEPNLLIEDVSGILVYSKPDRFIYERLNVRFPFI